MSSGKRHIQPSQRVSEACDGWPPASVSRLPSFMLEVFMSLHYLPCGQRAELVYYVRPLTG